MHTKLKTRQDVHTIEKQYKGVQNEHLIISFPNLKLREKKFMDERYTYWWKARSQCSTTVKPIGLDSMKIQFNSMAGVFIILVSGVIISLILVVVEVKFKWVIDLILEAGVRKNRPINISVDCVKMKPLREDFFRRNISLDFP